MRYDLDAWRQRTETPLMISAAAFLGAYAWQVLDPNMSDAWRHVCEIVVWGTWALFAADYVVRFMMADNRVRYFFRHLHDLAVVLLPMLRPLRLLRLLALLSVVNRLAGSRLRGKVVVYTCGATVLVLFLASLAILDAERDAPGAAITTLGDAVWWVLVSTSTIGYGDIVPVTATGRLVAVGLMLGGIALLGTVTATLASWLVDRIGQQNQSTRSEVAELAVQVRELRAELVRHRG